MQKQSKPTLSISPSLVTLHLLEAFASIPPEEQLAWIANLPEASFAALEQDLDQWCGIGRASLEALTEEQLQQLCGLPNREAVTLFRELISLPPSH